MGTDEDIFGEMASFVNSKALTACSFSMMLIILTLSFLPVAEPMPDIAVLEPGMFWSNSGTATTSASGTGTYQGSYRVEDHWEETYGIESVDGNNIKVSFSWSGSWEATLSGWFEKWWGAPDKKGTWSGRSEFTVELPTSMIVKAPKEDKYLVNTRAWFIINPSGINIGSKIPGYYFGKDVLFVIGEGNVKIKGFDVTVWKASWSGPTTGSAFIEGKWGIGNDDVSRLYDKDFGVMVGGSYKGVYETKATGGSIKETWSQTWSLKDSNMWVVVSFDTEPRIVSITVDRTSYSADKLPKSLLWVRGSSHTFSIESTVEGDRGVRYVFTEWSDGSRDLSRTITPTGGETYQAMYMTQYELTVKSDRGNPDGSGWYDAGSTATFSVTSPVPMEGFLGSIGAKYVFDHWSGDSTETTATATISMDSPKTVNAVWKADYTPLYVIIGVVAIAIIGGIAALMVRKKEAPPPWPPELEVPPVPPTPPPTVEAPAVAPVPAMKFCVHCGAQIPVESIYCGKCGGRQ